MRRAPFLVAVLGAGILPVFQSGQAGPQTGVPARFEDVSAEVGLVFEHRNGATPEKYLPETMGGGVVIFDYDNDGWMDVFLTNSGSFEDPVIEAEARHGLFHNRGDGTFEDRSAQAGISASGYGMGACAADYDGDGWTDLYLTNVGANALYRGTGTGQFTDVTSEAGVGTPLWSASCAFGDIDLDGDLDLYVTSYVDFTPENNKYCGDFARDVRTYCHPNVFNAQPDVLYRNEGDGTFTDISEAAGIARDDGIGLGVVFTDFDGDGWPDIYVANDSVPNFLFRNRRDGTFEEVGVVAGVAVATTGQPLAGMGIDTGDVDGDGRPDIFVSNLDRQTHSLYRNLGDFLFADLTQPSGVGRVTLPFVGFGAAFLDFDNDGDLDLAIANGDILDNVAYFRDTGSYPQRNLLLGNDGAGRFEDLGASLRSSLASGAGDGLAELRVSRGLAVGDLDNDGDLDMVVANNGQAATVLRNETVGPNSGLLVRVESATGGVGADLELSVDGNRLWRETKAGSSYLSQNDPRVHFGLASARRVRRLVVRWPGGDTDVVEDIGAGQILTIRQGRGLIGSVPLAERR